MYAFINRLSVKFSIAILVFIVTLAGATAFLVTAGFRRTQFNAYDLIVAGLESLGRATLLQATELQAEILEGHLESAALVGQQAAMGMFQDPHELLQNGGQKEAWLAQVLGSYPHAVAVYYFSSRGELWYVSPQEPGGKLIYLDQGQPQAGGFPLALLDTNPVQETVWTMPHVSLVGGEQVISAIFPMYAGETLQGVAGVDISITHLVDHLRKIQPTPGTVAYLMDQGGLLVAAPPEKLVQFLNPGTQQSETDLEDVLGLDLAASAHPSFIKALAGISGKEKGIEKYFVEEGTAEKKPIFLAHAPLPATGWNLVLAAPVGEITLPSGDVAKTIWDNAEKTIQTTMLVMVVFFLIALLATIVFTQWLLSRPINALMKGVQAITAGNLDVTIPIHSEDELSLLAGSFNRMAGQLNRRNAELVNANSALRQSEALYRTLAHNFPNGAVLLFDNDLRLTIADGAGLSEVGFSRKSLEGKTIWEVFSPEVSSVLELWFHQALEGSASKFEVPFRERVYQVWALPLRNERAEIFAGMAVTQDITERVAAQQILERRVEESTREIVQLYEQSAARSRELEALYLADEQLYRHLRLDQVLQALVDVAVDILHADKASVQIWNVESGRLAARAWRGYRPETVERLFSFAPGEGIAGEVFQTGQVMAVEDARSLPKPAGEIAAEEGICSSLFAPVKIEGEIFGVFGIDYCQARTFQPEDQRLFQALAQRAALAIENARLYEQVEQSATQEERQRLARELHDSVTQSLYSLMLMAEAGRRQASQGDLPQAAHNLQRLGETAQQALKEMRLLVYEMRPLALQEVGLVKALQQRLDAVEKRTGIHAQLQMDGNLNLPAALEEGLYRIAIEALNNSLKHAAASSVSLRLRSLNELVELEIVDNGQGFDPTGGEDEGGIGLDSMRERAERLGGEIEIHSLPGRGTVVRARLTIPDPQKLKDFHTL